MIRYSFKIPIYDFRVTVLEVEGVGDAESVRRELVRRKIVGSLIDEEVDAIGNGCYNGGSTYSMLGRKEFLVVLYVCTSDVWRREVINHEKRHIEDDLLKHLGISDGEASAYLAGYLSRYMY